MSDVKWIKLSIEMFDNRKIRHLRKLPEGNNIVLIWVMLLTLAGKCNAGGMIFLTQNIPYTTKMLADELDFEENTVRLALEALENFGMISTEGFLSITGWEEHQNEPALAEMREYNRIAKQKSRERQKQKQLQLAAGVNDMSMTCQEEEEEKSNSPSYSYSSDSTSLSDISKKEEGGMGEEGKDETEDLAGGQRAKDDYIAQAKAVVEKWNGTTLPRVARVSASSERGKRLIARLKEYGIDSVMEAVEKAAESKFLADQTWFDFGWFVCPNNFVKVLEGKYNRNGSGTDKRGRYDLNPGEDAENDPRWANVHYDISE